MPEIDQIVAAAGPFLLPLIGLATLLEYVFPPFPGDLVTAIGTALAVRGEVSVVALFAVTTFGALVGTFVDYRFGRWLQYRLEHPKHEKWREVFHPERLAKLEAQYKRWGPWLLVANRFVPVSRAVFIVFAGMSGIPERLTLVLGTVSAMAWNAMLIGVGYSVGANLDELKAFSAQYSRGAIYVTVAAAAVVAAVVWWRRRARKARKV